VLILTIQTGNGCIVAMLGRAALPLVRPRGGHAPVRAALSGLSTHRNITRRSFKQHDDYKVPDTAKLESWQQQSRAASNSSQNKKEPLRPVPQSNQDQVYPDPIPDERPFGYPSQGNVPPIPDTSDLAEGARRAEAAEPEPVDQAAETEAELRSRLPDLTQGIPSTLDAELGQAQRRHKASTESLNITEDSAEEPVAGSTDGQSGGRLPKDAYVSSSDRRKETAFKYTYLVLGLGLIGYSGYLGRNWDTEAEEQKYGAEAPSGWTAGAFYARVKARLGSTMSYYNDPVTTKLLPDEDADPNLRFPFTLVISLEDMLVHSEWTRENGWRIAKRPGVDYFLRYLSQYYEIVLFTSQPSAIADQVLRKLDPFQTIRWPLFREATLYKDGGYIKVSLSMPLFCATC